jgi:hypothetical protein
MLFLPILDPKASNRKHIGLKLTVTASRMNAQGTNEFQMDSAEKHITPDVSKPLGRVLLHFMHPTGHYLASFIFPFYPNMEYPLGKNLLPTFGEQCLLLF